MTRIVFDIATDVVCCVVFGCEVYRLAVHDVVGRRGHAGCSGASSFELEACQRFTGAFGASSLLLAIVKFLDLYFTTTVC